MEVKGISGFILLGDLIFLKSFGLKHSRLLVKTKSQESEIFSLNSILYTLNS